MKQRADTPASILVTGGAGYVGSHSCLRLLEEGYRVIVADNLASGSREALLAVEKITGQALPLYPVDICDGSALEQLFAKEKIHGVLHLAASKSVEESCRDPLGYYRNNFGGTLTLCETMQRHGLFQLVFSSTAAVYGEHDASPCRESDPLLPQNPYARSKLFCEQLFAELHRAEPRWQVICLRYFNPAGAHPSGILGEDPAVPTLTNRLAQVASQGGCLEVFGTDYPTPDGAPVRDYLHIMDVADGHLHALQALARLSGVRSYNLGCERGVGVLEMVRSFEEISGRRIEHRSAPRRAGDVGISLADSSRAQQELGWRARRELREILKDAWRWYRKASGGAEARR